MEERKGRCRARNIRLRGSGGARVSRAPMKPARDAAAAPARHGPTPDREG
jgi:hypothetical protein